MSKTSITVERVNEVKPHPNADRLDIIQVLGYQVVVRKGDFKVGDAVAYFPPDILIPPEIAMDLGVHAYLKHAVFPGTEGKTQCRVGAARLRGVASYGFAIAYAGLNTFGTDITTDYGGVKYEPPVRSDAGDAVREWPNFHRYTEIENIQRFPDAIPEGTTVRITEKIHGTNCRLGLLRDSKGFFRLVAGSHRAQRSEPSLYWDAMDWKILNLLLDLSRHEDCVIVYGEIFGPGVQDLDYGQEGKSFRVFDISVNGSYLDYFELEAALARHSVPMVPVLYCGPFHQEVVASFTDGPTRFRGAKSKFIGREGVVVTPLKEQHSEVLGGRMIVKSISVDYLSRKGAQDAA